MDIITIVAQNVQRLLSHMRKDIHTIISCIVNDTLVHSMPSVQHMLLSLFMIFNCLNALH